MDYLEQLSQIKLKTVRLLESNFSTCDRIDRYAIDPDVTSIQTRRWTEVVVLDDDEPGADRELTVVAQFGIRLIKNEDELSADPYCFYTLEAKYAVAFEVIEPERAFEGEFLKKFADRAPVNIVWPFWREHIFSTLREASLPTPEVSLMPAARQADTTVPEI
jgi:hypothetical protein